MKKITITKNEEIEFDSLTDREKQIYEAGRRADEVMYMLYITIAAIYGFIFCFLFK